MDRRRPTPHSLMVVALFEGAVVEEAPLTKELCAMPPRARQLAIVPLLCTVFAAAGCGSVSTLFNNRVGQLLGEVNGSRKVQPVVVGADAMTKTATALTKPADNSEGQATDTDVARAIRELNPDTHFAATVTYDSCGQSDPHLVKDGAGLRTEFTSNERVCRVAEPHTAVFAVGWNEVPNKFWFGEDASDPGRVRVDERTVTRPDSWSSKALRRTELPNSPRLTFEVAQSSKAKKDLLRGDDVDLKAKYSDGDIVIVTRFNDCPTKPELVLLGKRLVFYSAKQENSATTCGTNTVEIAAFVIAKKDLPKKFTLGAGEQKSEDDVTVQID